MARNWTDAQRKAISLSGGSLLVSAAAGSGKTSVLTERVISKIKDGTDIDRLLIVTFTNAAAAEMKARIKASLGALISENPDPHLIKQSILVSSAHICTVDSFCTNLLRENFSSANVPFDFKIGDETELKSLKETAAVSAIAFMAENTDDRIMDIISPDRDEKGLIESIIRTCEEISVSAFPEDWFSEAENYLSDKDFRETVYFEILKNETEVILRHAEKTLEKLLVLMQSDTDIYAAYSKAILDDQAHVKNISEALKNGTVSDLKALLAKSFGSIGRLSGHEGELKDRVKGTRDEIKKLIKKIDESVFVCDEAEYREDLDFLFPASKVFLSGLKHYMKMYSDLKAGKGIVDFSDVEHLALSLLVKKEDGKRVRTDLALELEKDFDEIMIDEFQDTNECQYTIFKEISKEENNLFMVGDVKQSIYRFRLADPTIFLNKLENSHSADEGVFPARIALAENFRSSSSVCSFVNAVFGRIMTENTGEIDYSDEQRLVPFRSDECAVEAAIVEKEDEFTEAEYVANRIEELIKEGYIIGGERRFPEYSDIAVIMRTRKSFSAFSKVFQRFGIPCSVQTSEGFFASRECSVLLSLLKVIDNPMLDVEMASVMMSPLFSFTPDDLIKLKLKKRKTLYECLKESDEDKAIDILEFLRRYKSLSFTMTASELIKRILFDTNFINIFTSLSGGEERSMGLRRFISLAKKFESGGAAMLSTFIRYCDKTIAHGGKFGSSGGVPGGNTVKIITVHASKGLEFPICFVSDTGRKFSKETTAKTIQVHRNLGPCFKIKDTERFTTYTTAPYEAAKALKNTEFTAEEMRILYVALTRAKDKLIVTGAVKNRDKLIKTAKDAGNDEYTVKNAGSFIEWVLPAVLAEDGVVLNTPDYVSEEPEDKKAENTAVPSCDILERLISAHSFTYKNKGAEKIPIRLSVSDIAKKKSTPSFDIRPAFSFGDGATASEKGTAMHKFMQYVNYKNAEEDIEKETERLITDEFLSEAEIKLCDKEKLSKFFESELYKRIASADEIKREYAFMYGISANRIMELEEKFSEEKVLVQGIADCIIIEGDSFTVIDYKTDRVKTEEELISRYRTQLELYKEALSEKLGLLPKDIIIYSFQLEKAIII